MNIRMGNFLVIICARDNIMIAYLSHFPSSQNLTWVKEKVDEYKYNTLQEFFQDIELIISNALTYNTDPGNPYHVTAKELKQKYIKLRKKVLMQISFISR